MRKPLLILLFAMLGLVTFAQTDSIELTLQKYKDLYSKGLISEQEYDKLRKRTMGIDEPIAQPSAPQKEIIIVQKELPDTFNLTKQQLYDSGYAHAKKYFRTGGVFGGTFATTFFTGPVFGLIPAIVCSTSPPKEANFISPNPAMLSNPNYIMGYRERAKREKSNEAWKAWGIAFFSDAVIATIAGVITARNRKK